MPDLSPRVQARLDQAQQRRRNNATRPVVGHYGRGGVCDRNAAECAGPVRRYMNARLCAEHAPAVPAVDQALTYAALTAKRLEVVRAMLARVPTPAVTNRKPDPWHEAGCRMSARKHSGPCVL